MLSRWQRGTIALAMVWLIGAGVYSCADDINTFGSKEREERGVCDEMYLHLSSPNPGSQSEADRKQHVQCYRLSTETAYNVATAQGQDDFILFGILPAVGIFILSVLLRWVAAAPAGRGG